MASIVREIKHDTDGKPVLILRKKGYITNTFRLTEAPIKSFAIRMDDIWQYSEEHNNAFERFMFSCTIFLCDLFDLGLATPRKMAEIATVIQEGIDDLVKLPPQQQELKNFGEVSHVVKAMRKGECIGRDVFDHVPINDLVPIGD
jgi:hypothetical protein